MHSLDDLIQFTQDLEKFVEATEKHRMKDDRNFFRCLAGPWLSRELLPRPEQDNSCRFVRCFQNEDKDAFVKQIVVPLLGDKPFSSPPGTVTAASDSLIGRVHQFAPKLLRGLELRLATIYAVFYGTRIPHVQSLLTAYQKFFGSTNNVWGACAANLQQHSKQTAAFRRPQKEQSVYAMNLQQVIHGKESYLDPAVAFLIDTILECSGKSLIDRRFKSEHRDAAHEWHPGQTYVITVVTQGTEQLGIVAKLLVEAVEFSQSKSQTPEDPPGAFYPHPHMGVHFRIGKDFQAAIRNAWLATVGFDLANGKAIQQDYRWSLIPYDSDDDDPATYSSLEDQIQSRGDWYAEAMDQTRKWEEVRDETTRHLCLWYPLSGPSATLPFALAIKSSRQNEAIRSDVAATADFQIDGGIDSIKEHQILADVGALPYKFDAAKKVGVKHLIVSSGQTAEVSLPKDLWLRATNLSDAYREATEIETEFARYADHAAGRWKRIVEAGRPKTDQQSN